MVIVVVTLTKRKQGNPPTVPAGIGGAMRLITPNVTDGINEECGV
jgi:hypothetical protein